MFPCNVSLLAIQFSKRLDVNLEDLLKIHIEKIENGFLSIPPSQWCVKNYHFPIIWSLQGVTEKLFCINGIYSNGLEHISNKQLYKESIGEYLAIPEVAQEYRNYEPPTYQLEECHRANYVYKNPDTRVEVRTPAGNIDCLTNSEIVEIKVVNKWKDGLGQLLAYSVYYPNHEKVLILFGKIKPPTLEVIYKVCASYSVELRLC